MSDHIGFLLKYCLGFILTSFFGAFFASVLIQMSYDVTQLTIFSPQFATTLYTTLIVIIIIVATLSLLTAQTFSKENVWIPAGIVFFGGIAIIGILLGFIASRTAAKIFLLFFKSWLRQA